MLLLLKSTHAFNKEFSTRLKSTCLPILPSNMGLLSFHLGLEQLKDRMIKSSTMSQIRCSTIILEFLQVLKK